MIISKKKTNTYQEYSPVMVQSSRRHSSRLLITANVLCNSSGASKNGKIAAPINEYKTTKTHKPGVENRIRNVKCKHRFVCITSVGSPSTAISPSPFSACGISMMMSSLVWFYLAVGAIAILMMVVPMVLGAWCYCWMFIYKRYVFPSFFIDFCPWIHVWLLTIWIFW